MQHVRSTSRRSHPGALRWCELVALFVTTLAPAFAATPSGAAALDWSWRFGSAIVADARDQALAQQLALESAVRAGHLRGVEARARQISGWRKGVVFARLARATAERGDAEAARRLAREALRVANESPRWAGRIRLLAAETFAVLGDVPRVEKIVRPIAAADRQAGGQAVAVLALARAAAGESARALANLDGLAGDPDYLTAWWRASGYLWLADRGEVEPQQRDALFDRAIDAAAAIAGWKQVSMFALVAESAANRGRDEVALRALERGEDLAGRLPDSIAGRAQSLALLARIRARLGAGDRAMQLLREAESSVDGMLVTERPIALGYVAASWAQVGARAEAERVLAGALDAAAALENARPRALAVAAICRWVGEAGFPLAPRTQQRIEGLYEGLGEPW
ncbi:MAG: hypothetical protein D6738_03940 [Acidobacteria bacterium]|nr:MAG: hypothetical protein D6738_03940 [Acidobacteriota bacterium]